MLQVSALFALILTILATPASAQRGPERVLLGEQRVGFRVDRDVIEIGHAEDWYRNRSFQELQFLAEGSDIHMMSVTLVYFNGYREETRVDQLIRQGRYLPINLRGDRSYLRRIEMVYRARPDFRGRAVIKVYGIPAQRSGPRPGAEWVLLGEQRVGFRVDRDVIEIGRSADWYRNRAFRSLQLLAEGNDIHMMSVTLVYFNGYREEMRVDQLIREGQYLPIDLRGDRSYLRRIEMVYRARPDFRGRAVLKVYGDPAGRSGPRPDDRRADWVELGCQQVALIGKDRDSIRVGRRDGRFEAIRLYARDSDVEILDLKVVYGNGEVDDISVRNRIRAGERTRPLDLKGRERFIDRIDLTYRNVFNPVDMIAKQRVGSATVCVEGRQ